MAGEKLPVLPDDSEGVSRGKLRQDCWERRFISVCVSREVKVSDEEEVGVAAGLGPGYVERSRPQPQETNLKSYGSRAIHKIVMGSLKYRLSALDLYFGGRSLSVGSLFIVCIGKSRGRGRY